ncbi:NUDIX hydrolase [Culicoidibacter larvae]|uniref:NUDIX hydrolase n=1 Tax=Culicoidibacter larvae TaxID=2579976 RepID=A0A5R8QDZ3_9FIRM|nr:NUDIX hydrolase [Culicoidibacter larvae]TLG74223.1 NUDIX hydrolase [Culicoidibacter larvae]
MTLVETKIDSKPIYNGNIITVSVDTVMLPNGDKAEREVARHNGGVCVLAVTAENKVVLVKQFRYVTGEELFEIPAGKRDSKDEDPYSGAMRELEEETPYFAERLELLYRFYPAPGFCDEELHLYQAIGLQLGSTRELDDDEFIEVYEFTKEEVLELLNNDKIHDGKTIIALQYWLNKE